ncbi:MULTISPECIES: iron-containing alcohol dehydrogenase [unclassified Meridianimarinicoccus]|uniref:iron-containing alcohol dehydrogenase n=1 Tax=unclassified Meridianimarinicoccus TaxID=2923344 RepID=UPI001867EA5A|nr:iron-containing alcohol dehydrogenase [Fluviibacterium sp. MJW13]
MADFALTAPDRTIFGRGCRDQTVAEVGALGARVLVVRGRSVAWVSELETALATAGIAVESLLSQGEPSLPEVRQGVETARNFGADCILAVGGGAVIDLGKAISGLCPSDGDPADFLELGNARPRHLSDPLPFVALPTTAGTGAEATRNAVIGVPDRQMKISLRDPRLLPDLAIVDPALTDGAPSALTMATGLDAITQLIESYLCIRANPVTDALCSATIPDAMRALCRLAKAEDPAARDTMARASHLSGLALANSGLGVVHGLASVIGGRGGAHGAICGRLLAAALTVNAQKARQLDMSMQRFEAVERWLAEALGANPGQGIVALQAFVTAQRVPTLAQLHVPEADFYAVAEQALTASSTKGNPVPLSAQDITDILAQAARG